MPLLLTVRTAVSTHTLLPLAIKAHFCTLLCGSLRSLHLGFVGGNWGGRLGTATRAGETWIQRQKAQ